MYAQQVIKNTVHIPIDIATLIKRFLPVKDRFTCMRINKSFFECEMDLENVYHYINPKYKIPKWATRIRVGKNIRNKHIMDATQLTHLDLAIMHESLPIGFDIKTAFHVLKVYYYASNQVNCFTKEEKYITEDGLIKLKNLRVLILQYGKMTDKIFTYLPKLDTLFMGVTEIDFTEKVNLTYLDMEYSGYNLNTKNLTTLQYLYTGYSLDITDSYLEPLVNLEKLIVPFGQNLTVSLFKKFPILKHLEIYYTHIDPRELPLLQFKYLKMNGYTIIE